MGKFTANGVVAAGTSKTALAVFGTAAVRAFITNFMLGTTGTPTTDTPVEVQARACTTAGTAGSAVTPTPTDGGPAAVAVAGQGYSAEPTYSGLILDCWFNPRANYPWAAYDQAAELLIPAVANNGIGWQNIAAGGAVGNIAVTAGFHQ